MLVLRCRWGLWQAPFVAMPASVAPAVAERAWIFMGLPPRCVLLKRSARPQEQGTKITLTAHFTRRHARWAS